MINEVLDRNKEVREVSGSVVIKDNKLVLFFYLLMRDYLTSGEVVKLVTECAASSGEVIYSNGWLAKYAEYLSHGFQDCEVEDDK